MSRKNKNKGENELLFITISNKRNLESVLNNYMLDLLTQRNELHNKLLNFEHDENRYKEYKKLFTEYKNVNKTIDKTGLKEFIYKDQNIDLYTFLQEAKKKTKIKAKIFNNSHKYTHKQPVYNEPSIVNINDLTRENNEIIQRFYSFEDNELPKIFEDFNRYKVIQQILSNYKISCKKFTINDTSYPRIITLLGGKCSECGSKYKLTLHHVIPKSKGGQHDILNLQLLCRKCHNIKHFIPCKFNSIIMQEEAEVN